MQFICLKYTDSILIAQLRSLRFIRYISHSVHEDNILTQPTVIWHATKNVGLGIEYQYWQNKLGDKDTDESVVQALAVWRF